MMYGFAPLAAAVPLPGSALPVVNVYAYKNNGVSDSGVVSAGALAVRNLISNNKVNTLVGLNGDVSQSCVWYGLMTDNDWYDTPAYNITGFQ